MSVTREIPMFPLGIALMPGTVLPLYVFEERYLQMYREVRDGDKEFGVILIERGAETADGNPTFEVGCVAELLGSGLHDDGSVSIVSVGKERLRVVEWLESDPYPKAVVEVMSEDLVSDLGSAALSSALDRLPTLHAMVSELDPEIRGEPPQFSDDVGTAVFQLAEVSGLQPIDLQRVLEAETTDVRAELVRSLVDDRIEMLQLQLNARREGI